MKVFLLTDLEGIAGIDDIRQMERGTEIYRESCALLCHSINLAVESCFANGADSVHYLDGHAGGGNVFEDKIDRRAVKCSLEEWQQLLKDGNIDCQIELGAHARAGTVGGFLDHTLSSKRIFCLKLNGMEMSELSLHAVLCAKYKVPVIAVIGDETACHQAAEYIPGLYVGAVKKAACRNHAESYGDADRILRETIAQALANYENMPLISFKEPAVVEQTFYRTDMCEEVLKNSDGKVERVDARTLRKIVPSITKYADLKF